MYNSALKVFMLINLKFRYNHFLKKYKLPKLTQGKSKSWANQSHSGYWIDNLKVPLVQGTSQWVQFQEIDNYCLF